MDSLSAAPALNDASAPIVQLIRLFDVCILPMVRIDAANRAVRRGCAPFQPTLRAQRLCLVLEAAVSSDPDHSNLISYHFDF